MLDLNQLLTKEFAANLYKKTMDQYRPQIIELLKEYQETRTNIIGNHEINKQILSLMKGYKLVSLSSRDPKGDDWNKTYERNKTLSSYLNKSVKGLFEAVSRNDSSGKDVQFLDVSLNDNEDVLLALEKDFLLSLIDLKHFFYLTVTNLNPLFKGLFELACDKNMVNINWGKCNYVFSAELYSFGVHRLKADGYFNYKGSFEETVENFTNILNTFLEEPTIESIEKYFELVYQKEVLKEFISKINTSQVELLKEASLVSFDGFDPLTLKGLPQKGKVFTLEVTSSSYSNSLDFCKNVIQLFNLLNLSDIDYDKLIQNTRDNPSKYILAKKQGSPFEVSVGKFHWGKENKIKFKFNELPCFN